MFFNRILIDPNKVHEFILSDINPNFEYDSLKGNINRMFVTDDFEEFSRMYEFAQKRLKRIYDFHFDRLVSDGLVPEDPDI